MACRSAHRNGSIVSIRVVFTGKKNTWSYRTSGEDYATENRSAVFRGHGRSFENGPLAPATGHRVIIDRASVRDFRRRYRRPAPTRNQPNTLRRRYPKIRSQGIVVAILIGRSVTSYRRTHRTTSPLFRVVCPQEKRRVTYRCSFGRTDPSENRV